MSENAKEFDKFSQLVQRIAPSNKLRRVWSLTGGVSAQVTAVEIEQGDGQIVKRIVRRHGEADLKKNHHLAADEFNLLQVLKSNGIPVPTPFSFDESCEIFTSPYIVLEFIEGRTILSPTNLEDHIQQLANHLARIHQVSISKQDVGFLPNIEEICARKLKFPPVKLDEDLNEDRIRDALRPVWPLEAKNQTGLLHGDYWPGNILWNDGQLAGIIDWEDAALGDPLSDVANARLEILWAYGFDAMNDFTEHYKSLMPAICYSNMTYWDLYAALRPVGQLSNWGLEPVTEQRMRDRHYTFVKNALASLN